MNFSENLYTIICNLYELYKKNPNIRVTCTIETKNNFYFGVFEFDVNFVINTDCLILKDVLLTEKLVDDQIIKLDKLCISFDSIKAFAYSLKN